MNNEDTAKLIAAIRSISHGTDKGPAGLEMLSMSISGDGTGATLSAAVSEGLTEIASAIREGMSEIADAMRESDDDT